MFNRLRISTALVIAVTSSLIFVVPSAPPAAAAGSPDISLSVAPVAETLHTDTTDVTLTASNPTVTDGFNLSYRVVLPVGVTYGGGPVAPTVVDDVPGVGQTTLFFENVSDLLSNNDADFTFTIGHASSVPVGSTVAINAEAYVNPNPRSVPDFDPVSGTVTGDFDGNAAAAGSTDIVAFRVLKTEPSPEAELVRGLHNETTVYTVTIENNPNAPTNDFEIHDWIPAGLEFLACGGGDNSTVGDEYPGSGPISTPAPADCVLPTIVETVDGGLPAGMPAGVYTHIVWNSAGPLGDVDIPTGGTYTFNYAAAIPMLMNTTTWDGAAGEAATDGSQASNIDNNNGATTQETESELAFTNRAYATGTYSHNATAYTHFGEMTVTSEDVALQKSVFRDTIVPGDTSTWTVDVQVSEYTALVSSIQVVDTVPDGLRPTGSTPAWASAVENSDGTWTVVWNLADMGPDASTTISYTTLTLTHYQENQANAAPVLAADSWENRMSLTALADGQTVTDDSADGQEAGIVTILKEVSTPGGTVASCGDGFGLGWDADDAGPYGPGDRVCWRLTVTGNHLYGDEYAVQDFLPDGFTYETWEYGRNNTADPTNINFDGSSSGSGYLQWALDDEATNTDPDAVFEAVISTIITGPTGSGPGDLLANLMKFGGQNTVGDAYQLRDDAEAIWGEPVIGIDKSADHTVVQSGDEVAFTIAVPNTGNVEALDVEVWDNLPVGLECGTVSAITGGGVCDTAPTPDRIAWTIPSIAAGGSTDLTYTVTVPPGIGANESFTNRTGVRGYQAAINTGLGDRFTYVPQTNIDPSQEASANVDPARDEWTLTTESLSIHKTSETGVEEAGNNASRQATIGEQVDYTVAVTIPEGTTVYNGVLLDDYELIDVFLTYLPGSASATINGAVIPGGGWTIDESGSQIAVSYPPVYTNAPGSGDDTLILTFSGTITDMATNTRGDNPANRGIQTWDDSVGTTHIERDAFWTVIVEPNLTISKTDSDVDGVVAPGQTVAYSLLVTNDDGVSYVSTAHDVVVTDTLPNGLDCNDVANISHGGTCADSNPDVITWSVDPVLLSLNPGASLTVTYDATFPDPIVTDNTFTNTAWVGGSSMAGAPSGERDYASPNGGLTSGYQDSDQDTLIAPQSSITKSVIPGVQTVGEPVQYTVEVTLPAGTIQYDVTIMDMLPSGIGVTSPGYTVSTLCESGSAGSGTPCSPLVPISELTPNGNDVGWFLGDLDTTSSTNRVVTIVYDAFVDDVAAAVDGATLTNSVNVYANQTDQLGGVVVVPDAPNYDVSGTPATADLDVEEPNLVLTKRVLDGATPVDARRALPNEDLTYEVTLTNNGNWPAYDAAVTDTITIPSGNAVTAVSIVDGVHNSIAYTVADGDPTDGTLEWFVDGPIPAGDAVTISYTVRVWDASEADENPTAPEIANTADNPSYWAVATHTAGDGHREYAGNSDGVEIELDLASIGNDVWFDANDDGVQDAVEQPIPNATVTVTYLGSDGAVGGGDDEVHVTTTDADGLYIAEDLPGGNYTVAVSGLPAGMTPSYDLDGGTATPDGAWRGVLAEDAAKRDVDFGYTGTASIGDLVWLDRNADGLQDSDEPGIGTVEVTVTFAGFDGVAGNADDVAYVTTTAANGSYLVGLLPAGDYTVVVTDMPLANVDLTYDLDDGTTTPDGAWSGALTAAEAKRDVDFGYNGDGLVGDTVWFDQDRDGVQDAGEPGIAGVDVWLTWPGPDGVLGTPDDVVFTETTDANGEYLFDGLNSGDYSVQVDASTLPGGMDNTFDEDGDLDGHTDVALAAGESHLTADFGYGGSGSIGDFVWWDLNGDGVQDAGESGIPGVDVEVVWAGADGVLGTSDDVTYVETTDADGLYLVEDLPDGDYRVSVLGSLPSSASNTHDFDGGGDSTADVALAGGVANLDLDFGYVGDNSIGDYVWFDANGDGVQDAAEPALSGVELTLTWAGVDGVFGTTDDVVLPPESTDAVGFYSFPGLPDGDYRVDVTGGVPVGMAPTYDEDGGLDQTVTVTGLAGGTNHDTTDFGYNGTGSIGDTTFWDLDGDGIQGADEPGFPNVDVSVTWAGVDGVLGTGDDYTVTAATDASGVYVADRLPGGLYRVDVDTADLPADVVQTADPDGGMDDSSQVILIAGGADHDQDFGYRGSSSIGDTVWFDVDGNGVQDPGEPGVGAVSVVVTWLGEDGVAGGGDDVTFTETTDSDGHYDVPGLVSGGYEVEMIETTLPEGGVADSDLDGGDPTTTAVSLGVGENRETVDYGIVGSASLAGTVWHDHDGDGVVDPGEAGIPGTVVHVTWKGPDGPVTIDVTTDASGEWSLSNLPAGEYTAEIDMMTVPAGLVPTTPESVGVTLPPFGHETVEHGVVAPAILGSEVWVDDNGNGIFDSGEQGIAGVIVTLLDPTGTLVALTTTSSTGEYVFEELVPGTYTVRLLDSTIPSNLEQTYSKTGVLNLSTTVTVGESQAILDINFGFQEQHLPVTGADLAAIAFLGLLLIAAGGLLRLFSGRRRGGKA